MNAGRWMWVMFVSMTACACAEAPATVQPRAVESATAAAPAAPSAPVVDPGHGNGPDRIGITESDITATNLPLENTRARDWKVGPYRVLIEGGRVVFVEAELRAIGGAVFGARPSRRRSGRSSASPPTCRAAASSRCASART